MEVPLAYLPGNVTRVKVIAVGDLCPPEQEDEAAVLWKNKPEPPTDPAEEGKATWNWRPRQAG